LHDQYAKSPTSIRVTGLASGYGAYIGEVIRKSDASARWESSDEVGGDKSYPLICGAGHLYPMAWCYRRIVNGDEDNVWVKYATLNENSPKPLLPSKEDKLRE